MPTNDERAERARVILEAYGMYVGDPDDPKANLTDVLVDLMHLSVRQRALGLEFNHRLEWLDKEGLA
jgi:hypothetical protein